MTRTTLTLIALFAVLVSACVAFGGYFAYATLATAHRDVLQSRFAISTERIAAAAERASAVSIALRAQTTLPTLLAEEAGLDPLVLRIEVRNDEGEVLFSAVAPGAAPTAPGVAVSRPIRTDTGRTAGTVVLTYDQRVLDEGDAALWRSLGGVTAGAIAFAVIATFAAGGYLASSLRRSVGRASDPATWPEPARRSLAEVEAVHAAVETRLDRPAPAASSPPPSSPQGAA